MIKLLGQLFSLIQAVMRLMTTRQLLEAGRAQQRDADIKETENRVEKAQEAVATPDPARDERLRNRFDRSRRSQ